MKRTCAYLLTTAMLITTVPASIPALSAHAAVAAPADRTEASVSSKKTTVQFVTKSGQTYCLDANEAKKTGWVLNSGKWYYFDKKDGHMVTGWLNLGTRKFRLRKDGSMVEGPGWYKIGMKYYYFTKNGHVRSAWEAKNGKWFYIDTNGDVVRNKWVLYGGKYYYLQANGVMATGKTTVQGKQYTFTENGALTGSVPSSVVKAAKNNSDQSAKSSDSAKKTSSDSKTDSKTTAKDSKTADAAAAKASENSKKSESTSKSSTASSSSTQKNSSTSTSSTKSSSSTSTASQQKKEAEITKVVGKLNNVTESRRKFVLDIAKYVRKYAPQYGIKVYSPIIAQAIHESGWGESSLAWKYHNYFGLKCGTAWKGKSVNLSTKEEYSAGTLTTIRDNFRVYDNLEQGVKGYFEFIQLPRYSNLKGVTSPRQYLQNIKNDGYATGSLYVDHTMDVLNTYNLTQFDK